MRPVSCAGCQALQRRLRDLQAENERLRRQLDEANRAARRQAAPFAKGRPAAQPKKPGRKPGKDYGPKACRRPPRYRSPRPTSAAAGTTPPAAHFFSGKSALLVPPEGTSNDNSVSSL